MFRLSNLTVFLSLTILVSPLVAAPLDLSKATSRAELDAVIVGANNAALKKALQEHAAAILAAAAQRPHVEAVIRIVASAHGKTETTNTTPASLKLAAGGDLPIFDTLRLVDLAVPNTGPHDKRKVDPYDAAFFEHVGHLAALESLNIISTKLNDEWITPLAKLKNLRSLKFTNNGKLTDAGLEKLAGLTNLETFSFVGTGMKGHAYAKFDGFTKLIKVSHRGSSIDDEGLKQLCEHLPNLESISLAHAKFTDAGAPQLAKLTKLKGLELGAHDATPQALRHIAKLPLEYLQLGEGFDSPECIPLVKGIATLRRLTLNNATTLSDADLKVLASLTQLEQLELGKIVLSDDRLPLLKDFAFLKSIRFAPGKVPYTSETRAKVKTLLPKVELKFE